MGKPIGGSLSVPPDFAHYRLVNRKRDTHGLEQRVSQVWDMKRISRNVSAFKRSQAGLSGDTRSACESFLPCLHQVALNLRLARNMGEIRAMAAQLPATPSCATVGSISRWDILSHLNERAILSLFSSTSIPLTANFFSRPLVAGHVALPGER